MLCISRVSFLKPQVPVFVHSYREIKCLQKHVLTNIPTTKFQICVKLNEIHAPVFAVVPVCCKMRFAQFAQLCSDIYMQCYRISGL